MTSPRHLWSGDWEQHSAEHAEALARRRRQRADEVPEDEPRIEAPTVVSVPAAAGPTLGGRLLALLRGLGRVVLAILRGIGLLVLALGRGVRAMFRALRRADRRVRLAAVAVLALVVIAVAAVVIVDSGSGSNASAQSGSPAAVAGIARWLGVQFTVLPNGEVVIETLLPGGAAGNYGFEPGDALSQVNNHPISDLGDLERAFDGVKPGSQIAISVNRGSTIFAASFPMPPRPSGGP
jgi:membrane-associated protease RseP (regulator of RpoE activity)